MGKIFFSILLPVLIFLASCGNENEKPEPGQISGEKKNDASDNGGNGKHPSDTQARIEPAEMKTFIPRRFSGFEVSSISGGASESASGRWTSASAVYRKGAISFSLRLYDWGNERNYPDAAFLTHPPEEPEMESKKISDGTRSGYAVWSAETGSGQINILYYGRFGVILEANLTDMEYERFMDLINEIDFQKMYNKVRS